MIEPWPLVTRELLPSTAPADIVDRLRAMPAAVEELSDELRARGIASSVDLGDWCANRESFVHVGPIATMRFAPKAVFAGDMRMGNAQVAPLLPKGAILVEDARGCDGCVLGGYAAGLLRNGGAAAAVIDGMARDPQECREAGLTVVAARFGVRSGRETLQAVEIGGLVTLRGILVQSGDLGIVNRNGLVVIPQWFPWEDLRQFKALAQRG